MPACSAHWKSAYRATSPRCLHGHPRRERILLAVGEHDNGWAELDGAPPVDPVTGQIYDFIHGLPQRGITVLLVDQNVRQCVRVSDHVYVLELGRRTRPNPYGMTGTFVPVIPRNLRLEVPERMVGLER